MEADLSHFRMQETPDRQSPVQEMSPPREVPSHTKHVTADHPVEVHFSFEHPQSRVGVSASVISHIVMALIAFAIMRYQPEAQSLEIVPNEAPKDIVWLNEPGPGGGGGGGGNKQPDPPKKAELPGKEKITVPVKKPEPMVAPEPEDVKPLEELNIPAKTMADAQTPLPGALQSQNIATTSQGAGTGGGAGTGTGTGIGPGDGSGLGPGRGGGTGGGAYRPGADVTSPRILQQVKPQYTADAMRAKVQGSVWLECIVMPDGSVADIRVTKSLDSTFGLDQEAIKAARQWKFVPGLRRGEPVPVIVTIELTFTLR